MRFAPLISMTSSAPFVREMRHAVQEDHGAMALIPFFGEGHLLWASGVWDAIARQMASLRAEMRQRLTLDNATELYGSRLSPVCGPLGWLSDDVN